MTQNMITVNQVKNAVEQSWLNWLSLNTNNINSILPLEGVYEIRLVDYKFPRLKGKTDIIYIGCSKKRTIS